MKGAIVVDTERCKGCQLCIIACPQKVIALANKVNLHGYPYVEAVNEEACVGCASCGIVCPDGCIRVSFQHRIYMLLYFRLLQPES